MFPHGTRAGYTYGCRQSCCRAAATADENRRSRLAAYGRPTTNLVDAEPVRQHVLRLKAAGFSVKALAEHTGVGQANIQRLVYGYPSANRKPAKRIRPETAAALLAARADMDSLPGFALIDSAGTRRRAMSLALLGHSLSWQGAQVGYRKEHYLRAVVAGPTVTAAFACKVRGLYDAWWDRPSESPRAVWVRQWAERSGALPPAAWDDDLIDLPEADLQAELSRRVDAMDDAELRRCSSAYKSDGDRTPLISAGAREWRRRLESDRAAA